MGLAVLWTMAQFNHQIETEFVIHEIIPSIIPSGWDFEPKFWTNPGQSGFVVAPSALYAPPTKKENVLLYYKI